MNRDWVRFKRFVGRLWDRLRWIPEFVVLFLGVFVVALALYDNRADIHPIDIAHSQALNIAIGVVLASFAYLLYFLRFRQAQLNRYLDRFRARSRSRDEGADPLADTIVGELLDARPRHACLIKGPAETDHGRLLDDVAAKLASKHWPANRVPVVVDLAEEADKADLPPLVRDRFVTRLVGSSGDEQNAKRLYSSLVKKEKVVALVEGLDRVGLGTPLAARRATISKLLEGSLAEGIPFVAWVSDDLAPSISEVAAFRALPMLDVDLAKHIRGRLASQSVRLENEAGDLDAFQEAFTGAEPSRDLALIDLAFDLFVRRRRSGDDREHALASIFWDPCDVRRQLRWMCEWSLDASLSDVHELDSASVLALSALGRESHFLRESELSWGDASRALDADAKRRFGAGIASLGQRQVLTASGSGSSSMIRFTHPMWFAFAGTLGLRLDRDLWCDLLQPGIPVATLDALTGALLMFGLQTMSFVEVLETLGIRRRPDISLEMVRAVIRALQADEEPLELGDDDIKVLEESWALGTDVNKSRFVGAVDFSRDPLLIDFLWEQVDHDRFERNSFRVRRAICTRLGQLGDPAWTRLNGTWWNRVASASDNEEALRVSSRNTDEWREAEYPLASLGWVLPGLLLTIDDHKDEAYDLLGRLRALQISVDGTHGLSSPDIGMEISLAEGFKAAAVGIFLKARAARADRMRRPPPVDATWWESCCDLLGTSHSWISQQALVQALALARPIAPAGSGEEAVREVFSPWEDPVLRHPFVCETARLVIRTLDEEARTKSGRRRSQRQGSQETQTETMSEVDIWFEGVTSLEDGGITLSPEAHQLLGVSTLLIDLAERRVDAIDDAAQRGVADEESIARAKEKKNEALVTRELIHTGGLLPGCFRLSGHAKTMHAADCDKKCRFDMGPIDEKGLHQANICGKEAVAQVLKSRRDFSRSFVQRAQVAGRSVPPVPKWFPRPVQRAWFSITRPDRKRIAAARAFGPIWQDLDRKLQSGEAGE